jgi:UDP-glucose 4-epimerase
MVLPNFVQSALLGKPITVYGDGDQTRSFTHVRDAVDAMTGLMSEPAAEGDVFNVGNDKEVTINELAEKVKKMTGSSSAIEHIPYEKAYGPGFEDMRRRCPNIEKIRKLIGFQPKYDLEAMIQSVIDYFKEYTHRSRGQGINRDHMDAVAEVLGPLFWRLRRPGTIG